jgi:hypothetical protein
LRFLNVIRLSSHTNTKPPACSPCDRHRPACRHTAPPSSYGTSFNTRVPSSKLNGTPPGEHVRPAFAGIG